MGERLVRVGLAVALGAAAAGLVWAQGYTVRAFIRPASGITETTPVELVVEVQGGQNPRIAPPQLGALTNLRLVGGPSTSSSFSWINGRASSSYQLRYTLLPRGPGSAVIPAFTVEVDSKSYPIDAIRFEVGIAPSGPPAGSPRSGGDEGADVFLRAELGTEEVWVGQPVPLTVTLFAAQRITDLVWRSQPSFPSFWVESLEVNPDQESYSARMGNRPYTAYPIERKVLIPASPGEFEIESFVLQMQLLTRRDWFDVFGRSKTILRKSEPLALRVRPLPPGAPDGFSGAVGEYEIQVALDRGESAVNDAVALRATVQGSGSLRTVEPPLFEAPAEFKVFDPEVTSSTQTRGGEVVSRKTWEWILVPLTPGEFELPAFRFPYFDPESASYRVATSTPLRLAVEPGEVQGERRLAQGGGIPVQRRDLAFIKSLRGSLEEDRPRVHQRGWFLLLLFLPLAWTPLVIAVGRRRDRMQRDAGLARARRARSRARKRLRSARRRIGDRDVAGFHEAVARTLVEYVADRFNRAPAGLTYEVADELLASRGVEDDLRRRFRACLEACDFARFVPATARHERRAEILDEAVEVVERLERAW